MKQLLPGTTIDIEIDRPDAAERIFAPMFLTGGLFLSQVSEITGLSPYVVQNWVKRGFVPPPENKRYSRERVSRILLINMLKDTLQIEKILDLIRYSNAHLKPGQPGYLDDRSVYEDFVAALFWCGGGMPAGGEMELAVRRVAHGREPGFPGADKRLEKVLSIMLLAYISSRLQREAEQRLAGLDL